MVKTLDEKDHQEFQKIKQMIKRMKLDDKSKITASVMHSSDEIMKSSPKKWILIEESTEIQEAVCNDAFGGYERGLGNNSVKSIDIADHQPSDFEKAERRMKSL